MPPMYAKQIQLMWQRGFHKLQATLHRKVFPSAPRNLGQKVPRTSLPISAAFLERCFRPNVPSVFPSIFDNFKACIQDFCAP